MITLESKAYGIPIICYDVFGIRSYIKNDINGYILNPPEKIKKITTHTKKIIIKRIPN
jgi:glycosyltransferase involved in cell wall biosynthesis